MKTYSSSCLGWILTACGRSVPSHKTLKPTLLALLLMSLSHSAGQAGPYEWFYANASFHNWHTAGNWNPNTGGPPDVTDTAKFMGGGYYLVDLNHGGIAFSVGDVLFSASAPNYHVTDSYNNIGFGLPEPLTIVNSMTKDGPNTVTFDNTFITWCPLLNVNAGNLNFSGTNIAHFGTVNIAAGAVVCVQALLPSDITALAWNVYGTLKGSGQNCTLPCNGPTAVGPVTVFLGGMMQAGCSVGTANIQGDVLFAPGSSSEFELGTPGIVGTGVNDLVNVVGNLTLNGTMNLVPVSGFAAGTYRLFNYTGAVTNNGVHLGAVPAGFTAQLDFTTTNQVNLVVASSTSYNITIQNCCTLIANQLNHLGGNTLPNIMPSLPCNARLMKWDNTNQIWLTNTYSTVCGWADGTMTLNPGEGAFLCPCPPCTNGFTLTFTGTLPTPSLPVTMVPGYWYLLSRQTPQPGTYDNITGLAPAPNATAFTYNCGQGYTAYLFDEYDLVWYPWDPTTAVGTAMWVHLPGGGGTTPPQAPVFPCPTNCVTNCCVGCVTNSNGHYPASYQVVLQANVNYLLVNHLCHGTNNTLEAILPNPPPGTVVYKYAGGGFTLYTFDPDALTWTPNGSATLHPGEGFMIKSPVATTLTFEGCEPTNCPTPCLPTNNCVLVGRLGIGTATWANLSSCPPKCGTRVSRWNGTGYDNYDFLNGSWTPQAPVLAIGESAFVCWVANTNCCLPPPSGMSAWWTFDETNGPIANDIAGFNNQGTWFNGPTPIAGMVSNALCFDGANDFVLVTNHPEINFSGSCTNGTNTAQSFTIDAWIRANANGASTETLLDKRVNPQAPQGYAVFLYDGKLGIQIATGIGGYQNYIGLTPDLRDGQWHFIALTVARCGSNNLNTITFYLDGNAVSTSFDPHQGDLNNTADLQIGRENPAFNPNYYSGCLDELEFFKRVLAAQEIQDIFNAGSYGKCKTNCVGALTLTCVPDKTVYCPTNWNFDAPTVIDPCCPNNNYQLTFNTITLSSNCPWAYMRTWTVVDCLSRTAVCSQVVTVVDTNPPVWTYYVTNKFVECGQTWTFDRPTASDECCGTNLTIWLVSTNILYQDPPCQAVYQATWQAMDCCSNLSTVWRQVIIVRDTTPPDLACVTNKTVECGIAWSFDWPSFSDVCCGTNVTVWLASSNLVSGNPHCWALYRGVWNARDCCSNTTTCTQLVTVVDTQAPILTCVSNKTVECNSLWSFDRPSASDPCCGTDVTVWLVSSNLLSGNPPCLAVWQGIWKAMDCCSNYATCTQTVTVVDTQPPILTTACVTNVFIIGGTNGQPPVPSTGLALRLGSLITSFGNCEIDRYRPHTFSNLPPCITRATLSTRIKACGNICQNDTINLSFTDAAGQLIGGGWERRLGSYTGQPDGLMPDNWCNYTTGHVFTVDLGALPLAGGGTVDLLPYLNQYGFLDFVCQDDSGVDYVVLTVTCCQCATNKTVECGSQWAFDEPRAWDQCCGNNVTITPDSTVTNGSCPWVITRVWKITDCCTNSTYCCQTVTVVDTQAPILTCVSNKTVECGQVWAFDRPSAWDQCCGTNVSVWLSGSNLLSGNPPCRAVWQGIWKAMDCCTNYASCTQTVAVVDTQAPIVTTVCVTNVFLAGDKDEFVGEEPSSPSAGLLAWFTRNYPTAQHKGFDNCTMDEWVLHTFGNLPACITAATLTLHLKPCEGDPSNDAVDLFFTGPDGTMLGTNSHWGSLVGPPGLLPNPWSTSYYPTGALVTVNLASLPGTGQNLLPFLNQYGFVDFTCEDDTSVDYLELTVTCCQCATNKVVECGTAWAFDEPTAWDLCCGNNVTITVDSTATNGHCPWIITRVWKITDCCTNSTYCCQTVTVMDTQAPILTCMPDKTVQAGISWNFDWPKASDACCGTNVTIASLQVATNGNCCTQLISQVWQATDCCTNSATCTQTVTVLCTTPPTITCVGNKTIICATNCCCTNWDFDLPQVSSLCCPASTLLLVVVNTSVTNLAPCTNVYTRTWQATDGCGHAATCSQSVTVATPRPSPVQMGIYCDSAGIHITFPTQPCYRYTVLYTDALSDHPIWTVLQEVRGDGLPHEVLDGGPLHSARFYRLRVDCPDCSAGCGGSMAPIPAGSFTMGDTFGEGGYYERPTHTVYLSAFCMDTNLVSYALWQQVYQWAASQDYGFDHAGLGKAANHPVHTVSWYDAVKWCNARSQKEGLTPCYYTDSGLVAVYKTGQAAPQVNWAANGYRLPTEAEWEKAARGGAAGHRFPWADWENVDWSRANYYSYWTGGHPESAYDKNPASGGNPIFGAWPATSPVGYFAPNGYGLYDMAGNVYTWCWDWHDPDWYSNPGATQNDTRGPSSGSTREFRGGSWVTFAPSLRCASRSATSPSSAVDSRGLRCVRGH